VYTVTLSKQNDTGSAITFDLTDATTGSATSGLDYTAFGGAGVISVADGATTGTLTVTVTQDGLLEATETVDATISNPSNTAVNIGTGSASANIIDDDTTTADLSVTTHGNEDGPVDIVYTVTLDKQNDTGSAITFDLTDAGSGSATSGLDYTAIGAGVISVADGATIGTLTVTVTDDALLEATETVDATLSNPSHAAVSIGTATATATISDDDNAPVATANSYT
ncbi:MAG: hypothetical protein GY701_08060, partial [Sulfitobacter sp.]|nr:hypothetical protein [Sulfitobacter sp.]